MAETMTKKWNRAPLAPERVEEMERYLNEMAHEGWQCCEIVRNELRFVRGEQDEYTYRVQYFYESRDGEKDDYLRTLGETGAALVGEYGEALILRKKADGTPFDLYSDLDSLIAQQKKAVRYLRAGLLLSLGWMSITLMNILTTLMNILTTLMNANVIGKYAGMAAINFRASQVFLLAASALLLSICVVGIIDCPIGLRRAKRKIASLEAERVIQE